MQETQIECKCISSSVQKFLILGAVTILSGSEFHRRMALGKKEWYRVLVLVKMVENLS